jgi:uncharacterized repeat protein (TIGR01451 family)
MKKILLYSGIALALVLGLILPMAVSVMAHGINGSKYRDPDAEPYNVGETIHYVMIVGNPGNNTATNTLVNIWDTLPDGSTYYFVEDGQDPPLVQMPGESTNYTIDYVVDAHDFEWIVPTVGEPYWGVRNTFQAEGEDSDTLRVVVIVEDVAEVILPPVGGEAFPVNKLSILVPWIALGAAIIAGAGIFVRRRHVRS